MDKPRIHVFGASCSGVTTLGAALAEHFGVRQVDVDDFFWMPTNPPYTTKRPPEERVKLILKELEETGWVLTGSLCGWGDALISNAGLIVFVDTSTSVRMQRLTEREKSRFGDRIKQGGDMFETHTAFRQWAEQYDDPAFSGRNRFKHQQWIAAQNNTSLRLDGSSNVDSLVAAVTRALS